MDYATARNTLKDIRSSQTRDSETVKAASDVVFRSKASLGDEVWAMLELDTNAALDMHDFERASKNIKELERRFGTEGMRVQILRGSLLEAKQDWNEAEKLYKALKEKDECAPAPRKRLVALNKSRNRMDAAAFELNEYLDTFMNDTEAWLELTNLYIAAEQLSHAAFCLEEVILQQPYNYAHHLRYAEVQHTLGGPDRIAIARKHYQQAADLKPGCARAMYGICLCTAVLGGGKKPRENPDHMVRLFRSTQDQLEKEYVKAADKGALMKASMTVVRDGMKEGK